MKRRFFLLLFVDFLLIIGLSLIGLLLSKFISHPLFTTFYWSIGFLIGTILLFKCMKIKIPSIRLPQGKLQLIPIAIIVGIWFAYIGEPTPHHSYVILAIIDPLVVAFVEELNYRGLLLTVGTKEFGYRHALLMQALFFAISHFRLDFVGIISYSLFGIIAGHIAYKYSINHAIGFHFVANVTIALLSFM